MESILDGITPLPDDQAITWSAQELTPQAAHLAREQAAARTYRADTGTILSVEAV